VGGEEVSVVVQGDVVGGGVEEGLLGGGEDGQDTVLDCL